MSLIEREAEAMAVDELEVLGGEAVGQLGVAETDGAEHFVCEGLDDCDGVGGLVGGVDFVFGADGWSAGEGGRLDLGEGVDNEQRQRDGDEGGYYHDDS